MSQYTLKVSLPKGDDVSIEGNWNVSKTPGDFFFLGGGGAFGKFILKSVPIRQPVSQSIIWEL